LKKLFAVFASITALLLASLLPAQASQIWTLQKFQQQSLNWKACDQGFYCASYQVPVDYNHIDSNTFTLQVLKHPANTPTKKIGTLILNPGGPGGSGVDYAYNADTDVSKSIENVYDLVGFDPRGVNLIQPIRCLNDKQEDDFLSNNGTVQSQADLSGAIASSQMIAKACAQAAGNRLGHYSTLETAKDMEILRILLHEPLLNYLGKSYGTYLGTLYAALYPLTTGKIVLDGAVDPNVPIRDQNLVQAVGFDSALKSFISASSTISLKNIQDFLRKSRTKPLQNMHGRSLTESLVITSIAASLYDPEQGWPELTKSLTEAFNGNNPTGLFALADSYNERDDAGHYVSNQTDIAEVISCLDFSDTRSIAALQKDAPNFTKAAPIFGPYLAYSGLPCHFWKASAVTPPLMRNLKTNPLLIIGTTRDPATPYQWAQGLRKDFLNSTLITLNGDGHTGANRGSSCVDNAMNTYLLTGKVPFKDLICELDPKKVAVTNA
jgi:pimeloyl-ACP methyl ester carboxylesterase